MLYEFVMTYIHRIEGSTYYKLHHTHVMRIIYIRNTLTHAIRANKIANCHYFCFRILNYNKITSVSSRAFNESQIAKL